jgi:hypothetical protein
MLRPAASARLLLHAALLLPLRAPAARPAPLLPALHCAHHHQRRCASSSARAAAAAARPPRTPPRPVTPAPRQWYREEDLQEQFVRGGGAGGQSVARTSNCVILRHVPSGLQVRCHATRSRDLNRKAARRELQLRLDDLARGKDSVRGQRAARAVKAARKARARARGKYGGGGGGGGKASGGGVGTAAAAAAAVAAAAGQWLGRTVRRRARRLLGGARGRRAFPFPLARRPRGEAAARARAPNRHSK